MGAVLRKGSKENPMKRDEWKNKIIEACQAAGTYRDHIDAIIDTLAGILEKRDDAEAQFYSTGGNPVVAHTNKGGNTNIVKNPALVIYMELNTQALAYWRDLGLTPSALKKMNGDALTAKATTDGFEKLLAKIGT